MTTASVFDATFADCKLVKTRSAFQVILEIPVEKADAALAILGGMPKPGAEVWVAVARLNPDAEIAEPLALVPAAEPSRSTPIGDAPVETKERREWKSLKFAARAGIVCADPVFWQWLMETERQPVEVTNQQMASELLRHRIDIASRRELDTNPDAAERYANLESAFLSYKSRGEHLRVAE